MKRILIGLCAVGAVLFVAVVLSLPVADQRHPRPGALAEEDVQETGPLIVNDPALGSEDEATKERRRQTREDWLSQAEAIATESGDGQAKKIVGFLRTNGCLASPHPLGMQFIEPGEDKLWVAIVCLLPGDEAKGGQKWVPFLAKDKAVAHFLPDERTLIVKSDVPFSLVWKGIVLLHEGNHACTYLTNPYDWRDPKTFCYMERDTHAFQNRIMRYVGGARYDLFLSQEVQRLRDQLRLDKSSVQHHIPGRGEYNLALDDVFGPALSDFERDVRQSHFWIHASFSLLEQDFKGDVEDRKGLFLKALYSQDGILPRR